MNKAISCISITLFLLIPTFYSSALVEEEKYHHASITSDQHGKGFRYNIQGWIYLHIEGDPYERGFQHGYLLSAEIADMLNRWSNTIHNYRFLEKISPHLSETRYNKISEIWWNFCTSKCYKMYDDKFPDEYKLEIQGIADGATSSGAQIHGRDITYEDILALNEMYEFLSKIERWIRNGVHPFRTLFHQIKAVVPELEESSFINSFLNQPPTHHCNGFIATGDATTDRQIVVADSMLCGPGSWWWTYYISLRWNVILDILPTEGNRIIMASSPGYIWSDHDYYQNDAGIVLIETTVPQGLFDNIGLPLSVRARTAMQYGESIDDVAHSLRYRNDGAMNAVWLIGDTKSGEIARFELGYRKYYLNRTFDGFYWSANNPENTAVRLEKLDLKQIFTKFITRILYDAPGFGYYSIFYRPENRDIKFEELGNKYYGEIDVDIVKKIMSTSPIADWNTDCKITDSKLLEKNGAWFFYGNNMGRIENLTNLDKPDRTTEEIHPTGWVRIFGLPNKDDFHLIRQNHNSGEQPDLQWEFNTNSNRNDFSASCAFDSNTIYASIPSGFLYAIDKENGALKWNQKIGENPTTPVVHEDKIFIGHSDGLAVFDPDGVSGWWILGSNVVSDPVIIEDVVLFGDKRGHVYSYSLETREEKWTLSLPDEARISLEDNGVIYVASGNSCYAFDVNTSNLIWNFSSDGMITSAPISKDGFVYFGSWDTFIYALNASNGGVIWKYETGWGIDTSPAIDDNFIFISSNDNNFYALNKNNGNLEWIFTCNAGIHSSPFVYDNNIFFGSDDGRIYSLELYNGDIEWYFSPGFKINKDVRNYITTPILSDVIVDNGVAYFGAKGLVYALNTNMD